MSTYRLILFSVAITTLPVHIACSELECGEGTIERDGECAAADVTTSNGGCGPGTVLQGDRCVGQTSCGPGTTMQPGPGGTIICRATGGGALPPCDQPLDCPAGGTAASLCGRMYDLETDEEFEAAGTPTACPTELTADGPCSVNIQFYSALEFATGMGSAAELTYDKANLVRDSCGRFAVGGLPSVPMNAYAIGARPAATDTTRRLAGIVSSAAPGEQVNNLRLYTMRTSTDMAWSTAAGLTDGTFSSKGVYVHMFLRQGVPVSGVMATFNGAAQPANDYYFTDTTPLERTMVSNTATATGPNGLALITGNAALSLSAYGGSGGGCTYAGVSGGTIRGVVFVQPRPDCQAQ